MRKAKISVPSTPHRISKSNFIATPYYRITGDSD